MTLVGAFRTLGKAELLYHIQGRHCGDGDNANVERSDAIWFRARILAEHPDLHLVPELRPGCGVDRKGRLNYTGLSPAQPHVNKLSFEVGCSLV